LPKLTAPALKKYRPGSRRREIRDTAAKGLYLIIQPAPKGTMSWAMRFRRPDGRSAKLTLGRVDIGCKEMSEEPTIGTLLTLRGAREVAARIERQRNMGRDVVAEHAEEKQQRRSRILDRAGKMFPVAARDYIERHARMKTRRWEETARLLGLTYSGENGEPAVARRGLVDRWRERQIDSIDSHDVFGLLDEARQLGIPGLSRRNKAPSDARARALFAALSAMFGWLIRQRRIDKNPCAGVARPDAPKARDRVLTNAEIVAFWRACDEVGEPFGQLLKLLLLTGSRLNEVAGMTRGELSEDGLTWSLSGRRTKNGRPHVVPLSPLAREILATVKPIAGAAGFAFSTTGRSPVSGWSKVKHRLDGAMQIAECWRIHDLRRTAATGMAELGIAPHIVEAALNHVSGAKAGVAGSYNRAVYADERRQALERWAAHIEGLVLGRKAGVLSLARGRS
jgi:integrase